VGKQLINTSEKCERLDYGIFVFRMPHAKVYVTLLFFLY